MEKISTEAKKRYSEKIKEYQKSIDEIQDSIRQIEGEIRSSESEPASIHQQQIKLSDENLNLVSFYIIMNSLSLSLLGIKNEGFLNEARKCCYKSIICLEEVVTTFLDVPFSEYEEGLASIAGLSDQQKYNLVRKLGYSIDTVVEGFGENSKWKWSFVELEGRYAVVAKNLINMKTFVAQMDPRVEGYSERVSHLSLVKKLMQQSSDRYREKYELSTLRLDDIKKAILFLAALRRLHLLLGETEETEVIKRKIDIWKSKMESDQKKQETERKIEKLKRR